MKDVKTSIRTQKTSLRTQKKANERVKIHEANLTGSIKYEENPFVSELSENSYVKYRTKVMGHKKTLVIVNKENDNAEIGYTQPVIRDREDKNEFLKVFLGGMRWLNCMPPITKVLFCLLEGMEYKTNHVYFDKSKCVKETGLSIRTIERSIATLISERIILQSARRDYYWVNPTEFYKGDRIEQIDEANNEVDKRRIRKEM